MDVLFLVLTHNSKSYSKVVLSMIYYAKVFKKLSNDKLWVHLFDFLAEITSNNEAEMYFLIWLS
jgi:hypothetical protein